MLVLVCQVYLGMVEGSIWEGGGGGVTKFGEWGAKRSDAAEKGLGGGQLMMTRVYYWGG